MFKSICLLLCIFESFSFAKGQSKTQRIDSMVKEVAMAKDFNGTVLISDESGVVYKKNIGFEFKNSKDKVVPMCVGSITKTFTAAAIAMLWEQGIINLDDHITKYIPSFQKGDSITIRMLLTHTSGLKREVLDDLNARKKAYSTSELTDSIIKYPLDAKPGKAYSYSNAGYALLARVIEIASHKPYDKYLHENIFVPLQMNATLVVMSPSKKRSGFDPAPYPKGIEDSFTESPSSNFGAGNIYSTADDIYKWYVAFSKKDKILKAATWDTILRKAYGFGRYKRLDKIAMGHDGIVNGFIANMDYFEKEKTFVFFISNIRSGALNYLQTALPQIFFEDTISVPALPKFSKQPSTEILKGYVGSYELFPGFNLDIMLKDGRLYLRGKGGYFTYLDYVQPNTFFYRSLYAYVEFKKTGDNYTLYWKDLVSGSIYPGKKV